MRFLSFFFWTLTIAFQMSVLRFFEMMFYWPDQESWGHFFKTLLYGFRFDLLIVGYWMVPVVVVLVVKKIITGTGVQNPKWFKAYLLLSWIFICYLYFLDLAHFPVIKDRLWLEDFQKSWLLDSSLFAKNEWWVWIAILILILGLLGLVWRKLSGFLLKCRDLSAPSLAAVFLWTVCITRGSLGSDHLRRNDCNYSSHRTVKALCMNPVFTFSKNR